jgi:hypothetical protein
MTKERMNFLTDKYKKSKDFQEKRELYGEWYNLYFGKTKMGKD